MTGQLSHYRISVVLPALLQQRSILWFGFGFVGWDDYGGGYFVVGVEVEEFYS